MKKIILTDADGVLVNWNDAFEQFMISQDFPKVKDNKSYSLSVRFGIPNNIVYEQVVKFNNSKHILDLQPFADAPEYISKLVDDGFRFIVITSLSSNPEAKTYRTINLTDIYGDIFDDVICLPTGSNKYQTLMTWYNSGYFWIEDHIEHAEAGLQAGLQPVLIEHPYNTHYETDKFPVVDDKTPWQEIYRLVNNFYN